MHAVVLACAAQAVYIVAYVLFKTSTGRMAPIGGRHPLHAAGRLVRSPRWLTGVLVLLAGFALSATALVTLPVVATLPAFGPLLYGEPWPQDTALFLLRTTGVALAVLALLAFPRHERRRPRPARPRPAAPDPHPAARSAPSPG